MIPRVSETFMADLSHVPSKFSDLNAPRVKAE
jgi:hypothetical protein